MAKARHKRRRGKAGARRRRAVTDGVPKKKPPGPGAGRAAPGGRRKESATRAVSHGKTSTRERKRAHPALSQHPEAIRSRRRRREARGIREQLAYEALDRSLARQGERDQRAHEAAERRDARRAARDPQLGLLHQALGWLEEIRNLIASLFPVSLDPTYAVEADAPDEGDELGDRQRQNMRAAWLVVGRYTPVHPVGYLRLAQAFRRVDADHLLAARIHPQRYAQIRIVYEDPHSQRGEGDSIVSEVGPWEFVLSELIRDLIGTGRIGLDGGPVDEDSLAARYEHTRVPMFYAYFSRTVISYRTPKPFQVVRL